jgi:hypothetical protein
MKRLWGVRHIRYFWLAFRVHQHARMWAEIGVGLGHPNSSDIQVLEAIWRGER